MACTPAARAASLKALPCSLRKQTGTGIDVRSIEHGFR
jgi:hypothetical protein